MPTPPANTQQPMTTNTMSPSRRFLTAVSGYLLIGLAAQRGQLDGWVMPVVAALCAIYVLIALRAAAPGLLQRPRQKRPVHPVQAGKVRLSKREHAAMMDRV